MGGEIGLESVKGQGSTFWFTTVFNIGSFSKSITDRQHQAAVPEKFDASVLVAEDNATNQIVAQGTLEYLGCSVDLAENGREAVARVAEKHYDLIFMDCQMPVMDGYESTENIRKAEHQAGDERTPIIALTAYAMKGDRERCLAVGMDDYMTKPFNQQQLVNILSAWLPDNGSSVLSEPVKDSPQEGDELSTCNSIDKSVLDSLSQLQQPGKPDIIKQLVTVYLQRSPKVLQDIHEAAESNDIEKLWQAVHSLKSSSAILGACRLASLCHELEVLGRENQVDDPVRIAQEIKAEFKVVADELERILSCR
jgi:CheY-like chemotaxis protein